MGFLSETKRINLEYDELDKKLKKRIRKKLCLYPSRNHKCPNDYRCIKETNNFSTQRKEYLNQIIHRDYEGIIKSLDETDIIIMNLE